MSVNDEMRPGRSCPVSYRYAPKALAQAAPFSARTLYVIGGLYGNRQALRRIESRAAQEQDEVTLVFNGDFHWFDIDHDGFGEINEAVMCCVAMRGNVETELAGEDSAAGCGCGYPAFVDDAEVDRSNRILERLRDTARAFPQLRDALSALPMFCVAEVGGLRIGIVHGDAESLAGWGFSQEALREPRQCAAAAGWFEAADVRVFASSHSCLPVMQAFASSRGRCLLANNGAAGMPNFRGMRDGLITRISAQAAPDALYGSVVDGVHVEALAVPYDSAAFERDFLMNWPAGSPAHASYHRRIVDGPAYRPSDAMRYASGATV